MNERGEQQRQDVVKAVDFCPTSHCVHLIICISAVEFVDYFMGSCVSSLWPKQSQLTIAVSKSQKLKEKQSARKINGRVLLSLRQKWPPIIYCRNFTPECTQAQNNHPIISLYLVNLRICVQFKCCEVRILSITRVRQ